MKKISCWPLIWKSWRDQNGTLTNRWNGILIRNLVILIPSNFFDFSMWIFPINRLKNHNQYKRRYWIPGNHDDDEFSSAVDNPYSLICHFNFYFDSVIEGKKQLKWEKNLERWKFTGDERTRIFKENWWITIENNFTKMNPIHLLQIGIQILI